MFDIGWSEMGLILMVALIVIGPKDLPRVARQMGKWTTKARAMAREFQRSIDDMAREAELQDIKADLDKIRRTDVKSHISDMIDPDGEMKRSLAPPPGRPLDPDPPSVSPQATAPQVPAEPVTAAAERAPPVQPQPLSPEKSREPS